MERQFPSSVSQSPFGSIFTHLCQAFTGTSAGICLGEAKGKDFIPSQELALSTALTPNAFPSVELEWEDAIKFLKKEALVLPSGIDKGYVLVRYQRLPLGFVKNLGNRANNLYPQEWRIRTGYIPEEIKLFLGR